MEVTHARRWWRRRSSLRARASETSATSPGDRALAIACSMARVSPVVTLLFTLAVTDALPWRVKLQVFTLLPPLEHAPDQTTSRPLVALSVIDVPVLNVAEPVLPTATLIPAGLELTRSPLRPVAVTVSVAV